MPAFAEVLEGAEKTASGRALSVPQSWHQGRTAYGGFSSALALDEALRVGEDLPPLRSAQIAMIAPLAERVETSASVLRRGRNAIWIETRVWGEKGLGLIGNFVFMHAVESELDLDTLAPPEGLIPPEDAIPLSRERGARFLRENFEARHALARDAQDPGQKVWWIKADHADGLDPKVAMLVCADALPPGVMSMLAPTVPVSTMHWQINFSDTDPRPEKGFWLLRSSGDFARQGNASQTMAMWGAGLRTTLSGTQSIALFG